MNNLIKFSFSETNTQVRFFESNGELYTPFQDVRRALKVERRVIPDSMKEDTDYVKNFTKDEFERAVYNVARINQPSILCLTEAGIYEYISISKSPYSKAFRKVINKEILPQIRKTGNYINPNLPLEDMLIEAGYKIKEEKRKRLNAENQIKMLEPIVKNYETLLNAEGKTDMEKYAKATFSEFRLGRNNLFKLLRDLKIYRHDGKHNIPFQKFMDAGYFEVIYKPCREGKILAPVILITAKGLDYITTRLRKYFKENNKALETK